MAHWSDAYLGLPYAEADCAALATRVRLEVFGVPLPAAQAEIRAASPLGRARQVQQALDGHRVEQPEEGDLVLMHCRGRPSHVGVLARIGGIDHVLHAMKNHGSTCLHRLRDLRRIGLDVEGYYRV